MTDYLLRISTLAFLTVTMLCNQVIADESTISQDGNRESFVILGGSKDGTYDSFIKALNDAVPDLDISHKQSGGSKDNIKMLGAKSDDFAIVQADVAYNTYRGRDYRGKDVRRSIGFSALLPLFPNYVQLLVHKNSKIKSFSDLKGKRVGLGNEGSGTYSNALDILDVAKLSSERDLFQVLEPFSESIIKLDDPNSPNADATDAIDALFVTGKLRIPKVGDKFKHLEIPVQYIDQLAKKPYYTAVDSPVVLLPFEAQMLSLTAYLLASDSASHARVEQLITSIVKYWPDVEKLDGSDPRDPAKDFSGSARPIPYHVKTQDMLEPAPKDTQRVEILGGSIGGTYNKFIEVLNVEDRKLEFRHVESGGSKDNLKKLDEEGVKFAIVQDDAAFNEYYSGSNMFTRLPLSIPLLRKNFGPGFQAVLPLFPNYVQVLVRRKSGIEELADLKGKRVGTGKEGSATLSNAEDVLDALWAEVVKRYPAKSNAKDVLDEAETVKKYQAKFKNISSGAGIEALKNGELDALFITGRLRLPPADGAYHQIPIPEDIINKLTNSDKPYYQKIPSPVELTDFKAPMLSLTAYLVVSDKASPDVIETVLKSITKSWPAIKEEYKWHLKPLDRVGAKTPIPFHPQTNAVLANLNYVTAEKVYWPYLLVLALISSILFYALRWISRDSYNRVGQTAYVSSDFLDKFSPWFAAVFVIALFCVFLLLVVIFVNGFETLISTQENIDNDFFTLDIWENILWIFTFMATGHTEGERYPASTYSQIVVAIAAMVGLVAPFILAYSGISKILEKRFSRLSGSAIFDHLNDHVLICGWNAQVRDLIWTLTGEDAPSKKQVLVIADIDGEKPLTHYNFDKQLVNYCRGDSADNAVLERANAKDASVAIIVADDRKLETNNLGSALTVLALRERNPDIFIASELDGERNQLYFDVSGADAIVDARFLSERLLTLSCLYPHICDFVLDAITHDEHSEFYSQSVDELCRKFKLEDGPTTLAALQDHAHRRGLNIVGAEEAVKDTGVRTLDSGLVTKYSVNPLLSGADLRKIPSGDDTVIVIADELEAVGGDKCNNVTGEIAFNPDCRRLLQGMPSQEILIIGEKSRAEGVLKNLRLSSVVHEATIVCPSDFGEDTGTIELHLVNLLKTKFFDSMLILNEALGIDALSDQKAFVGDAKVILRAKLIARLTKENPDSRGYSHSPRIVAEVNQQKNRRLLTEAGATTIVPSLLLTARFLTKLVYGRGYVYRTIVALLKMQNGVYLRSLQLPENHPLIGKTYLESLRTMFEDARIIGWLPNDQLLIAELKNNEADFATHFITSPLKESTKRRRIRRRAGRNYADKTLQAGDTLIVIGNDLHR